MANRNTLSVNHIDDFKAWLVADGFTLHEPVGFYEVIRATKPDRKHVFLAYRKIQSGSGEWGKHLTVADRDMGVVRAFLRDRNKKTMEKNELKPCPFCGGEARIQFDYEGKTFADGKWDFVYYAHCTKCFAMTAIRNRHDTAAELWNTRTDALNQTPEERNNHGR